MAAARLGADVTIVAALGDDEFGGEARAALAHDGVGTDALVTLGDGTGVALILVDEGGENAIAVAPGANARLTPAHVAEALPASRPARATPCWSPMRSRPPPPARRCGWGAREGRRRSSTLRPPTASTGRSSRSPTSSLRTGVSSPGSSRPTRDAPGAWYASARRGGGGAGAARAVGRRRRGRHGNSRLAGPAGAVLVTQTASRSTSERLASVRRRDRGRRRAQRRPGRGARGRPGPRRGRPTGGGRASLSVTRAGAREGYPTASELDEALAVARSAPWAARSAEARLGGPRRPDARLGRHAETPAVVDPPRREAPRARLVADPPAPGEEERLRPHLRPGGIRRGDRDRDQAGVRRLPGPGIEEMVDGPAVRRDPASHPHGHVATAPACTASTARGSADAGSGAPGPRRRPATRRPVGCRSRRGLRPHRAGGRPRAGDGASPARPPSGAPGPCRCPRGRRASAGPGPAGDAAPDRREPPTRLPPTGEPPAPPCSPIRSSTSTIPASNRPSVTRAAR